MARSNRSIPEINAGSMADIAFLLLIFFLVTTTMDVDTGIARKLPVLDEEQEIEDMQGNDRNIYEVYVNNKDALLVEEQEMDIDNLREGAKEFLNNNGRDPKLSDNPEKAIISLQNSRGTSYEMYIAVQNELTAAYNELRDEAALRKYNTSGELIWAYNFSSSVANESYEILETENGDLVFAGYSGTQHGEYKFFMVKTDLNGNQIWKKAKNSTGDAILYSICESPDVNYIAAGFCNSWRSNLIVKRNALNGNNIWNQCIIGEFNVSGIYDITPASGGGYYLIDERSFLTKIDDEGQVIFSEQIENNQAVIELHNGDLVVGGRNAFLDGGYGGSAAITRLSFSSMR